jgi:endonuclease/exonuclease/phosphatase family metal-dependent hydrolase
MPPSSLAVFDRHPEAPSTIERDETMSLAFRRAVPVGLWRDALIAAVLLLLLPGMAQAKDKRELRVMTRNLYLGSSLNAAVSAPDATAFLFAVAGIYSTVQFTDFPTRANAIADEIATHVPDIIGLQEVSNWTSFGPGAIAPSLDFLAILQQALADRGLAYSVAAVSDNANIGPVPLLFPCGGPLGACFLSFQDRDVILVNDDTADLAISNPQSGSYATQQILATPVGSLSFSRGWCSIDGRLDGKKFRFVNTHLETEDFPAVQEAQGQEFLAGPAKAGGAVIATGDFNSAADGSTTTTYADLTKSYFDDAWDTNPGDAGLSCCQNETLTNPTSLSGSRIDLVLTHAASRALDADLVGDSPFGASPPFWASDHAGVVATLRIH